MRGDRDDRSRGGVPLKTGGAEGGKVDRWRSRLRSEFFRQLAHTLATRVVLLPLGVAVSVLVTRALGPEGRGELAVATTLAAVCVQFTNLGLHTSNTYFVSKRPELLSTLTANTLLVSLTLGGTGALVAWALVLALPRLAPLHGPLLALSLLWVPVALASMLVQNLLIGIQQVRVSNRVEVAQKLLGIALLVGIIGAGRANPATAFAANLVALAAGLAAMLWALWPRLTRPLAAAPALLVEHARYGLKSYFTSLCAYLMLRIDVLMVQYMRGPEQVGYYSVAVSMADLLYMVPSTIGVLLFPRLSAMPSRAEQWRAGQAHHARDARPPRAARRGGEPRGAVGHPPPVRAGVPARRAGVRLADAWHRGLRLRVRLVVPDERRPALAGARALGRARAPERGPQLGAHRPPRLRGRLDFVLDHLRHLLRPPQPLCPETRP